MSTSSPPADPVGAVRRLHRSREDRILGGVCAGLARYFNIDPTIVRIGAAALLLLGGVGIIAYLAAWLLVPEDGTDEPILRTGIAVEHGRTRVFAGGALLVVAVLVRRIGSSVPSSGTRSHAAR
jgi:phage shock protein PspC (stress-responsive transcriptional regulator)